MTPSQSDEDIVIEVQKGNTQHFGLLVERYEVKMMRYASKFLFGHHDGQDLVQEVFLKAYVNIQAFDTNRKFSSWLYRIAHNEFINAIKRKGREPLNFFDPDTLFPHPIAPQNIERDIDQKHTQEILNICLDKVDPKYREPLVLYYFEDLDYHTISEVMQIPESTVGVRLIRGKAILKKIYEELTNHGK